jgi:GT2 family glycosyltransferase
MPFAPDAPGPLLRRTPTLASEPAISVIVSPGEAGPFAALLESLRLQTLADSVEVIAAVDAGAGEAAVAALERYFAGRNRVVEQPRSARRSARVNAAAAGARGQFLVVVSTDIVLHDARTLATLCVLAQHDKTASAGCMLVRGLDDRKQYGARLRSAGIFAYEPGFVGELDCLEALGCATYPVAANSAALLMAPRDTWRTLDGFDAARYPDSQADIDYGIRAQRRGFVNLCTTAVAAELVGEIAPYRDVPLPIEEMHSAAQAIVLRPL